METLYHYTNLEAFLSILKNRKLWLTGIHNLNDAKEINWTLAKVDKKLNELLDAYGEQNTNILRGIIKSNKTTPYVCSLSTEPDLLSQWRAYAKDGAGVAIGFKRSLLPDTKTVPVATLNKEDSIKTRPVIYSELEQDEVIERLMRVALDSIANPTQENKGACMYAVSELHGIATTFKNPAFHEEREWRLIHVPFITDQFQGKTTVYVAISEPQHRVANNKLVTYFEYDLGPQFSEGILCDLVLGPKCEISEHDLSVFLSSVGLHSLPYRKSDASYR